MNTLIFVLVCYGACNAMVYGSIFEGFRDFLSKFGTGPYSIHKLFTCMLCLPTWMGFVISFLLIQFGLPEFTPFGSAATNHKWLVVFLSGLLSSGSVWLLHTIQEFFERFGENE